MLDLLRGTIWGTNGPRYTHLHLDQRIQDQPNPYFVSLNKDDELLAVVCYSQRTCQSTVGMVNAYYVRYFAFSPKLHSTKDTKRRKGKDGFFRTFLVELMNQPLGNFTLNYGENTNLPTVYYAYVDGANVRSVSFIELMDFEDIGVFHAHLFSRLKPRPIKAIDRIRPEDRPGIRELIRERYGSHQLYFEDRLFHNKDYYTIRINGEPVVGCQVFNNRWQVHGVGGKVTNGALKVWNSMGFLRKVFNTNDLRFVSFDSIFAKPGYEYLLIPLFEGILHKKQVKLGMCFTDDSEEANNILAKQMKEMGLVAGLLGQSGGNVVARGSGLSNTQWEKLRSQPVFISSFDGT
jgi:hypothetical protein